METAVAGHVEQRASYRGVAISAALVLLGGLVVLSARGAVGQLLPRSSVLTPAVLLTLLPFVAWSFGLRVLRWHVLLRRLVAGLPLTVSLHTQLVGFALAATPGRIAELYKLRVLERAVGVQVARGLPAILVERLTDVAAFGSLVLVGGGLSWTGSGGGERAGHVAILGLGLVALLAAYQVGSRHWPRWQHGGAADAAQVWARRLAPLLPGATHLKALLSQLRAGAARVASPSALSLALGCVILGRLSDALVIWLVARAAGYPVPIPAALLLIGAAGLAGGLSLSPGGLGAAEATLTALILARGIPLDAALTIAFVARALIFWLWVTLGLLVFAAEEGLRAMGRSRWQAGAPPLPKG